MANLPHIFKLLSTGTRIRTQIKGFGDLYSTIELCPYKPKAIQERILDSF